MVEVGDEALDILLLGPIDSGGIGIGGIAAVQLFQPFDNLGWIFSNHVSRLMGGAADKAVFPQKSVQLL